MDTQYPAHPSFGDVVTDALDNVGRAVMVGSLIGTITGAAVGGVIGGAGPAFSVVLLPEAAVTCLGGALIGASIGALAGTIAIGGGALIGASAKIAYTTASRHRKP